MNRLLIWLGLALLAAAPVSAAELLKVAPARLDPAMAYVLVEIANHDEGRMKGSIVLARYDVAGGDVRGGLRSPDSRLPKGSDVRIGVASKPLVKTDDSRLYLVALEPDEWVIEGAGGTAFSLGSKRFTAVAGEVLDLGVVTPRTDWPEGEGPERLTVGKVASMAMLGVFAKKPKPRPAMLDMRARMSEDLALPAALAARAGPASFTAGAKFGNYLGGLVNRVDGRKGRPGAAAADTAATADTYETADAAGIAESAGAASPE